MQLLAVFMEVVCLQRVCFGLWEVRFMSYTPPFFGQQVIWKEYEVRFGFNVKQELQVAQQGPNLISKNIHVNPALQIDWCQFRSRLYYIRKKTCSRRDVTLAAQRIENRGGWRGGDSLDIYSADALFESRPIHWLYYLTSFCSFLQPLRANARPRKLTFKSFTFRHLIYDMIYIC